MQAIPAQTISDTDLWYLLNHPWAISRAEWRLGDENSKKTMFTYIRDLLGQTEDEGYAYLWKTQQNEPIAVLGCYAVSEKNFTTFLVCSHHYEVHAMDLSFQMRKTLKEKAKDYKGCTLGIYSSSEHPHLFTWLRFLGFTHLPQGDKGEWRYFEYTTPS